MVKTRAEFEKAVSEGNKVEVLKKDYNLRPVDLYSIIVKFHFTYNQKILQLFISWRNGLVDTRDSKKYGARRKFRISYTFGLEMPLENM